MTEQGYPPQRPGYPGSPRRAGSSHDPSRAGWQTLDAFDDGGADSDAPHWAVPGGIAPIRHGRPDRATRHPQSLPGRDEGVERAPADRGSRDAPPRRARIPGRSRAATARRRRSKRRLLTWGGAVTAAAAVFATGYLLTRSPAPKPRYVTTWLQGDLRVVPDTCRSVGATMLRQYLAGTPTSIQPYNDKSQSQCTYTVDKKPTFRVLNITAQAYQPNLTVPGNGSATAAAAYTFAQQRQLLVKPPKNTAQPSATITSLGGLGAQALVAVQVFHLKAVIDRVTVITRYRNVLMTVYISGQTSEGFGPVSVSGLRAGAIAITRQVLDQVERQPTVG